MSNVHFPFLPHCKQWIPARLISQESHGLQQCCRALSPHTSCCQGAERVHVVLLPRTPRVAEKLKVSMTRSFPRTPRATQSPRASSCAVSPSPRTSCCREAEGVHVVLLAPHTSCCREAEGVHIVLLPTHTPCHPESESVELYREPFPAYPVLPGNRESRAVASPVGTQTVPTGRVANPSALGSSSWKDIVQTDAPTDKGKEPYFKLTKRRKVITSASMSSDTEQS